jgi:hypothetical protein
MNSTFKRTRERQYSAHHTLMHIASLSLERADRKEPGWFNEAMVAITFSALAMEAMANAIGDRVVPDWKDFESATPNAKLRLLAERLGASYDRHLEPWSTLRWLGKLRNQIAHPKSEHIVDESIISERERDDRYVDPPESKIEREITIENARRAVKALYDVKWHLCDRIAPERSFGLGTDGWTGSTELHNAA